MPKKLVGQVTSATADKTIVITVTSRETHPLYGKKYTVTRKYMAHDADNRAQKGDLVEVSECRPVSKRKVWRLERVLETGRGDVEVKQEKAVTELTASKKKDEATEETA